jgi:ABC-type glutathione transport system ATPase component
MRTSRDLGLTYLFISHDLRMVELVAHRVMVVPGQGGAALARVLAI